MATVKKRMSPLTELSDHLLAEIFLLLPATEDLARASAACVSFRRLATDRSFLRCFRRLHAPPLLGFLDRDGFHPTVPHHPSAPAAHALSLAADFTFSFLPSNCRWAVQDLREGRVLLASELGEDVQLPFFTELVVCDPLHRRYVLIPPFPDDLAASMEDPDTILCLPSLIPPSEEDGAADETAFRVIWLVCCKVKLSIFVFSSSTGRWQAAASHGLRDLLLAKGESALRTICYVIGRHYACGCVYWELMTTHKSSDKMLVLDTRRMELSIADHPPNGWNMGLTLGIVEAGEDKLGMFRIIDETARNNLCYIIGGNRGLSSTQWQVEKTISLDPEYQYCIRTAMGRYLLLARGCESYSLDEPDMEYFSLDVETLQLERVSGKPMWSGSSMPHLYTNFPPSLLSSPTV